MTEWEAPAKLNLDLRVRARNASGLHPVRSLVQTIEWCDSLTLEEGDEDRLEVKGAELPEGGENLVWKAVDSLGPKERPPLDIRLIKRVAVAAGLGGGSSDAAATIRAVAEMLKLPDIQMQEVASSIGADVAFFLTGGTARMEGHGERITPLPELTGLAVAVAVPDFELPTPEVYRRWDRLGGPTAPALTGRKLPPPLRDHELGNDLTPAAIDLRPQLADWISDLAERWERPALMTGSGPACFSFFQDLDEASDALAAVGEQRATAAAGLRNQGVARTEG